jgi:hypothetical protein
LHLEIFKHALDSAVGGSRTRKPLPARDFESLVYTNSTTTAK